MYSIYLIENKVNNKPYIGFTKRDPAGDRLLEHFKDALNNADETLLHKSMRKYNFDDYSFKILYQSQDGDFTHNVMEEYYIREYKSHYLDGYGYNMTYGGEGVIGYKWTEEQCKKASISHTGLKQTKETVNKRILKNTGKKRTTITRKIQTIRALMRIIRNNGIGNNFGKKYPSMSGENSPSVKLRKSYRIIKNNGEEMLFTGMSKFCRENGYTSNGFYQLISGRNKKYKDIISIEEII